MQTEDDQLQFENRWLRVVSRPYHHKGQQQAYTTVLRPDSVTIIPVTPSKRTLLLSQLKVPIGKVLWDFPAGLVNPGESPEAAARRELDEETGIPIQQLERLGDYHPAPGLTPQVTTVFSAVVTESSLDTLVLPEGEDDIQSYRVCYLDDIPALISDGTLCNSFTLTAFLLWTILLRTETQHP